MKTIPFMSLQRQYRRLGPDIVLWIRDHYGSRAQTRVPLMGKAVYLLAADDIHDMLVRRHDLFIKPRLLNRVTSTSFGQGLFTSEGEQWRLHRKLMQPHFHHVYIRQYAERMVTRTEQLTSIWQDGDTHELNADMHGLTFRILLDSLFSASDSNIADRIALAMHDLGEGLRVQSSNPLYAILPEWFPLPVLWQKRRGVKLLDALVQQLSMARRGAGEANAPRDLLSMLLFSRDADTGQTLGDQQLHDELVTLYIAGHETTALTLAWVFVMLAKHPSVEAKLHRELDQVLNGSLPSFEMLEYLPYTQSVIKETLRLYPPAWFVSREPVVDVELSGGDVIPKGAVVLAVSYATHRDVSIYDSPLEFLPERWSDTLERSLPKGGYIPFGLGPRICIGNGFALLESQLVLATLAQKFQLELLDEPAFSVGALTLAFQSPIRVRLHRR